MFHKYISSDSPRHDYLRHQDELYYPPIKCNLGLHTVYYVGQKRKQRNRVHKFHRFIIAVQTIGVDTVLLFMSCCLVIPNTTITYLHYYGEIRRIVSRI